jgi:hypothetical protein
MKANVKKTDGKANATPSPTLAGKSRLPVPAGVVRGSAGAEKRKELKSFLPVKKGGK